MDTCEKYTDRHWLSYLLNRVGEEEQAEMQYHLQTCPMCRERMRRIRAFNDFLQAPEKNEANEMLSVASGKRHRLWERIRWRLVAAGVGLLLAAGGSYYWVTSLSERPERLPVEIRRPPVYESIDTCRHKPDSLPLAKKKENEKK